MSIKYNEYVKAPNKEIEWTPELVQELIKCEEDFIYFATTYVKVAHQEHGVIPMQPRDYQLELWNKFLNHNRVIGLLSRQSGKTSAVIAYVLWFAIFNESKNIGIVSNKEASAKRFLMRLKDSYQWLPEWLKPGVSKWAETSVRFENGTLIQTAATSGDSFRGEPFACVTGDTKVCICDDDDNIFYTSIEKANSSRSRKNINSNMKKYYYIYKITNLLSEKIYIGFHSTDDLNDGYMGSGKYLKRSVKKYGIDNFKKEIIQIFDNKEDAEKLEAELVDKEFVERKDTYNISLGGNVCVLYGENNGFYGKKHSQETIEKIIKAKKGFRHTEETKEKCYKASRKFWDENPEFKKIIAEVVRNRVVTEETRKKLREINLGKKVTEETRHKISEARKNYLKNMTQEEYDKWYNNAFSDEKNKIRSEKLKGRECPQNQIINRDPEKIRKTAEAHRGMKRSEEAKKKMSEAKKGKTPKNKGKVYCYNPDTLEKMMCKKEDIPENWVRGFIPKELKCKS